MFRDLLTNILPFEGDLFRNIKTARVSIDCYDDLGDGELDTAIAVAAEAIGHTASYAPTITRPFDYGVIVYPFLVENLQETRFSDGREYGVWYGSQEMKTTVFETVYHWVRFIEDSFAGENIDLRSDRRVCLVYCNGVLIDLRGKEEGWPALVDPENHGFTQELGRFLFSKNQNGLLVKSARCPGINAAIFTPEVLSNPRDHCYLTYVWNPAHPTVPVRVERTPGAVLMTVP